MGIKINYTKPGLKKNLELLISEALNELDRKDWNMESKAAHESIAKHLSEKLLEKSAEKKWWDKYFYSL